MKAENEKEIGELIKKVADLSYQVGFQNQCLQQQENDNQDCENERLKGGMK